MFSVKGFSFWKHTALLFVVRVIETSHHIGGGGSAVWSLIVPSPLPWYDTVSPSWQAQANY